MYPNGRVTSMVDTLVSGGEVVAHLGTEVDVLPTHCRTAALVAGGTGITPMLAMIRSKSVQQNVWLFWWLCDRQDLFLVDELIELRDQVMNTAIVFSQGDAENLAFPFEVMTGGVEEQKFGGVLGAVDQVIVCGPPGFNEAVSAVATRSGAKSLHILG
jgi:NAD(P)H-flavin reductase